jgi:phosphatidylserine synthase
MRQAYIFLIGASIFDKLDGALARKLGLTEPPVNRENASFVSIGGVLDDIADAVSFCLAPALIFYITLVDSPAIDVNGYLIGIAAFFYFIMGVARLIYFTIDSAPIPGFFKGMPTPAAAILVVAPLLLYSQAIADSMQLAYFWGIFSLVMLFVVSLAMNLYPVHYMHLGRFMDRNPLFRYINIGLLLVAMLTPLLGYIALMYLLLYLISPVITWRYEQNGGGTSRNIS